MHNNNWGTTLLGAILLLLMAGGLYTWHSLREAARKAELEAIAARDLKEREEFERELRTFAESHPDLKVVQDLIDELEQEIQLRRKKLNQLAVEMRRASRAPETDPDYIRWNKAIIDLEKKRNALLAERRDTWLEWKKVENNPERDLAMNKARDDLFKKARSLAEKTREQFNDLRDANVPDEPTSAPAPEDAPPKKRSWFPWLSR